MRIFRVKSRNMCLFVAIPGNRYCYVFAVVPLSIVQAGAIVPLSWQIRLQKSHKMLFSKNQIELGGRLAFSIRIRIIDRSRVRRISRNRASEFVESVNDLFSVYEMIYSDAEPDAT
jgi:hypothetical protein